MFHILTLILISGTFGKKAEKEIVTPDTLYSRAYSYFQARKYSRSAELFKQFIFKYPLSDSVDNAQYYLARSYKEMKNFDDAISEYQFLITTFSTSEYIPEALLDIAECYILRNKNIGRDTEELAEAMKYINNFKNRYSYSPLIERAQELEKRITRFKGEKYLYIARTYLDIGYPQSAEIYLDLLEKEFKDDEYLINSGKLLRIQAKVEEGKCDSARLIYSELTTNSQNPESFDIRELKRVKRLMSKKCKK
ncbi:MAG: tetratricopeptide repeat protein [candidate division WOR-3 bacterium]